MALSKDPKALALSVSKSPAASGPILPNQLDDLFERVSIGGSSTEDEVYTLKSQQDSTAFFVTNLIVPKGFAWRPFAGNALTPAGTPLAEDLAIVLLLSDAQAGASSRALAHTGINDETGDLGSHGCVETKLLASGETDLIAFEYKGIISIAEGAVMVPQTTIPAQGWIMVLGLLPNLSWIYMAFSSPSEMQDFIQKVQDGMVLQPNAKWIDIGSPVWNESLRNFVARPGTGGNIILHD